MKILLSLLLHVPIALFAQPQSPNFLMGRESFSAVAVRDSTQNYVLRSTVGQLSDVGAFASPDYVLKAGYLSPVFIPRQPVLVIDRDTVNFGDLWINTSSEETFVVQNTGNADLVVDSVHSENPLIASITAPMTIAPGQSQSIFLTVSPPDTITYAGSLVAHSNSGNDSVLVTAHGIWTELVAQPAFLDFGAIAVSDTVDSVLTFHSIGNTRLDITSVSFSNNYFSLLGPPLVSIEAYSSSQRVLRFRAESTGLFLDTLVLVNSAGPDVRIPLSAGVTAGVNPIEVPREYLLEQNFPNPFNPSTSIRIGVPREGEVVLEIYDMLGRRIATLLRSSVMPGYHTLFWSCSGCPTGLYFVRMSASGFVSTRKIVLLK